MRPHESFVVVLPVAASSLLLCRCTASISYSLHSATLLLLLSAVSDLVQRPEKLASNAIPSSLPPLLAEAE